MLSKIAYFGAALAASVSGEVQSNSVTTGDIYVFAYTWTPEFCYGKVNYYGCLNPESYWTNHFTVHGLWPQYSTGGYPSYCTTEPFDPNVATAIGWDVMTTYWPNVQYAETDPNYDSFWEHEWTKHGTCSGLSQLSYFNNSINLIKQLGTPSDVTAATGSTMSASTLRNDFGGATYASLQCITSSCGSTFVNGVFTCWSSTNGIPTTQIECPADVQKEDTCTASIVTIESL